MDGRRGKTSDGNRPSKALDKNEVSQEDDELTKLKKELAKERALRAAAEAKAIEADKQREEADKQREEADKQREEANKQREEEQRLRLEAEAQTKEAQAQREEEHRRRIEQQRDMAAAEAAMENERAAATRESSQQQLSGYLAAVDRLNYVMPRLIPPPRTAVQTLSEGAKAKPTTSGRTTITNKYYPLKMRVWPEFPQTCRAAFARIQDLLGEQALFPSKNAVGFAQTRLLEDFPTLFLGSESFINEMKTSHFLHESLQIPTQKIINAYNRARGREQQLFFDNRSTGWMSRSRHGGDSVAPGGGPAQDATTTTVVAATVEVPRKTQPDCLVLCAHVVPVSEEENTARINHVHRATLGEHKAIHRLRAPVVARYAEHPLPEDFMLKLAKRDSPYKTAVNPNNPNPDAHLEALAAGMQCQPGQVYYARALSQTFHYMVTSGTEYGYLASGETLTLLRVDPDDPTTLLYCPTLYPNYARGETAEGGGGDAEVDVGDLAISAMAGLCLLAFESSTEPFRRRTLNLSQLALFPALPPSEQDRASAAATRLSSPQSRDSSCDRSRGRRRRREDGDDNDDNSSGGRGQGYLTMPAHRPRKSSLLKRQRTASTDEVDDSRSVLYKKQRISLLQRSRRSLTPSLPTLFDPSSFRPIRPYCTQACLHGLVFGEAMDHNCPNIVLHLRAAQDYGDTRHVSTQHAITADELHALVQDQLLGNMEQDCECLLSQGQWGAIGCLFKITVTGYGYTLVAKGVQSFDYALLRREVGVYDQLADQQGFLIPVCLGIMRLQQPYPMDNCMLVTHMLLMSYAGQPLYSQRLRNEPAVRYVNLEQEARRTVAELYRAGLVDEDEESEANMTWCAERGRVMRIDFDQAKVRLREKDEDDEDEGETESQLWPRPLAAPSGHSQDDSGAWLPCRQYSGHSVVESLLLV